MPHGYGTAVAMGDECVDDEGRVAFSSDSGKTWRDGPTLPEARSIVVTP